MIFRSTIARSFQHNHIFEVVDNMVKMAKATSLLHYSTLRPEKAAARHYQDVKESLSSHAGVL